MGEFLFFIFLLLGAGAWIGSKKYNELQRLAQNVKEAHANIMASMKKRVDLVNQLIDTVANYGNHEKLTHITVSSNTAGIASAMTAYQEVNAALNRISMFTSGFPNIKADALYQNLMSQLQHLEQDLQGKREAYNSTVKNYNICRRQIPQVLFAAQLGFHDASFFDVASADSLENLRDFKTDDGELLKATLVGMGNRVMDTSRSIGSEVSRTASKVMRKSDGQFRIGESGESTPPSKED